MQAVEKEAATMFDGTGLLDGIPDEPAATSLLTDAIGASRLWVAVADGGTGDVVGFALAIWCGDDAHLQELDVFPSWGRRGIGRRLVAAVCEWAADSGCERVTLTTFVGISWNAPFYAGLGFSVLPVGTWTDAHRVVWEHELAMGLPMEQRVVMAAPLGGGPVGDGSG